MANRIIPFKKVICRGASLLKSVDLSLAMNRNIGTFRAEDPLKFFVSNIQFRF